MFVGRAGELERLQAMLERVRCAVIYGVPGVGKTALARAFAEAWPGPVLFRAARETSLIELLDDARRFFAGGDVTSEDARLTELAAELDERSALLVIDDLHALPEREQRVLLGPLVELLRSGSILATSRVLAPRRSSDPDRFELKLTGLELRAAHRLWSSLSDLYGPSTGGGFAGVWERTKGNPLLVKRAHCGDLGSDEEDPIRGAIDRLDPESRRILAVLALAAVPIPAAALEELAGRSVLKRTIGDLIVELDAQGSCSLHDLFREAASASLSSEELRSARHWLAGRSDAISSDPVVQVREAIRHLVALERWDEADDRLVSRSHELVRSGAAGELLRLIDRIPQSHRSLHLCLIRARALGRVNDFRAAYDELERLGKTGGLESILALPLAQVALLTGRLDVAEAAAARCAEGAGAPVFATLALALVWTYRGEGARARAYVATIEARADEAIDRGTLAFCRAFSAWVDDDQEQAEEAMRESLARFREVPEARRAAIFASGMMAEILSRRGRLDEAAEYLQRAKSARGERVDPRLSLYLRAMTASHRYERGERLEVLAELGSLREEFDRAGYVLAKLWSETLLVRLLYALGRRQAAEALLTEATAAAERSGVETARRSLARAREEEDPLVLLGRRPTPPRATRGHPVRDRVLAALRESALGNSRGAKELLSGVPPRIEDRGYALDRAIAMLARGGAGALPAARAEAEKDGADPALLDAIGRSLDRIAYEVIVDGRKHQLFANGRVVSLGKRRALRRILYELAARPGSIVSRDHLARALWTRSYDPLVHENALKSNISNLRKLIDDASLSVECDDFGYRLVVPERFLYLPEA